MSETPLIVLAIALFGIVLLGVLLLFRIASEVSSRREVAKLRRELDEKRTIPEAIEIEIEHTLIDRQYLDRLKQDFLSGRA